jgi:hypothetical protein
MNYSQYHDDDLELVSGILILVDDLIRSMTMDIRVIMHLANASEVRVRITIERWREGGHQGCTRMMRDVYGQGKELWRFI